MALFVCANPDCDWSGTSRPLLCPKCEGTSFRSEGGSAPVQVRSSRGGKRGATASSASDHLVKLASVSAREHERTASGISEFDRVAGGGLVAGSLILLAGEPGAGKSTLTLQLVAALVARGKRAIYVTGEESASQIRLRAERLGLDLDALEVLATTDAEAVSATLAEERPDFAVIDSVQTLESANSDGVAGGMSQVREVASLMAKTAKSNGVTLLMIGHVTKDAAVAGPKTLEHLVDAVLLLEGERAGFLRVLRAAKNRYGAVDEIGLFDMRDTGMVGVEMPTPLGAEGGAEFGRAICPVLEGTRPLLVEVQALVAKAGNTGNARRVAIGVADKRVAMLLAVLERYADLDLGGFDVYVQVSSGITVNEPAIDAAICAAIASSYWETALRDDRAAVVGEVGLGGELRSVRALPTRMKETSRLAKTGLVGPRSGEDAGASFNGVANLRELLDAVGVLAPEGATPVKGGRKVPAWVFRSSGGRADAGEAAA